MKKINAVLLIVGLMVSNGASAMDNMTFKGVPWGVSQKQLMMKNVFKDVTCIKAKSERRLVSCFGDTSYFGEDASASITFLDNKLSSIELELDETEHSLYRYKEIRDVLTDKYGLPKKCDEPTKPVKSEVLNVYQESLDCYWISRDGLNLIRMGQHKLIRKADANPKKKYSYGLSVAYGLIDDGKTVFKLGQEAIAKEEFKRKNDL